MMDNLKVKCKKDNYFEFRRNVGYACGCEFDVDSSDIYSINFPDYEGNEKKQYYVICPNCGYINMIDEKMLSDEIKETADVNSGLELFQYRKNNLKSELIYFENVSYKRVKKL